MEPTSRLVSIIIVNWNGWADTVACVESCASLDYPAYELIVVDNGSTDGSADKLRERFPDLQIIESDKNLGFAGGNNLGISRAMERGAAHVWLLNNDTVVEPATLASLVTALEAQPDAGVAGSKIYYFDRPDTIWFAGGTISPTWGWTRHVGEGEVDAGQFDQVREMDYATGASLIARREVLEDIGLMDESYFLYWEETDFCERARGAGWRIIFVPGSRVWHKVGASTPDDLAYVKSRYEGRNRVRFYLKNRPSEAGRVAFRARVNAAYLLAKGRPKSARAMMRGVTDAYAGRSGMIES